MTAHIIQPDELKHWRHANGRKLILDLAAIWAQACLGFALAITFSNWVGYLIGFVIIAGAQHGLGQATHEAVHGNLISANRSFNDIIGGLLFAGPILVPFEIYRNRHLHHHRHCSELSDTKWLYRRRWDGWYALIEIIKSLSGFDFVAQVLAVLRNNSTIRPIEHSLKRSRGPILLQDFSAIAFGQLWMFAIISLINPIYYLTLWIAPLLTLMPLFSKARSAVEHRPFGIVDAASGGTIYFGGTKVAFFRSVKANYLERLIFSKLNFSFHAEHHLWPSVSYQYLPILHERMRQRADQDARWHCGQSYGYVLSRFFFQGQGNVD